MSDMNENKKLEGISTSDIVRELNNREMKSDSGMNGARGEAPKTGWIILGAFIYAFGLNVFIQPLNFYSGGFTGVAQLITYALAHNGIKFYNIDLTGILYYILNIPALILAVKSMRKRFMVKTILAITFMTIAMTIVPIPAKAIIDDHLASAIVGGILCGGGIGMILRNGACDGGLNLVGMVMINGKLKASIGQFGFVCNLVLFAVCLFLFDIPTVIYSILFSLVVSVTCDMIHTQNINSQVLIISKREDTSLMEVEIMGRLGRGLTRIDASGAFSGQKVKLFLIYLSKHEVMRLKILVKQYDPEAFIAVDSGIDVDGYFLKKLT